MAGWSGRHDDAGLVMKLLDSRGHILGEEETVEVRVQDVAGRADQEAAVRVTKASRRDDLPQIIALLPDVGDEQRQVGGGVTNRTELLHQIGFLSRSQTAVKVHVPVADRAGGRLHVLELGHATTIGSPKDHEDALVVMIQVGLEGFVPTPVRLDQHRVGLVDRVEHEVRGVDTRTLSSTTVGVEDEDDVWAPLLDVLADLTQQPEADIAELLVEGDLRPERSHHTPDGVDDLLHEAPDPHDQVVRIRCRREFGDIWMEVDTDKLTIDPVGGQEALKRSIHHDTIPLRSAPYGGARIVAIYYKLILFFAIEYFVNKSNLCYHKKMQKLNKISKFISILLLGTFVLSPISAFSATLAFNPEYIISDQEMQSTANWAVSDIQKFLLDKGSYLAKLTVEDISGQIKSASEIIYQAAQQYQINPKYILVTLQKEQSLITDDTPTQKQLDWAAGYGVCDSCSMEDPKVVKFKGFAKQVDNAAGIIRWYYNNTDRSVVKKKDQSIRIDNQNLVPQSWATAFLYTYTPHIHGNQNFWRIWSAWFSQMYPNGSLLKSEASGEVWLIQNKTKRKFKNQATLLSRANPDMILSVADSELSNYQTGSEIAFPNYSILKTATTFYLLDYDTLRPFASADVVSKLGYNPEEYVDITEMDIAGYEIGPPITATTTAPQGVIYQITDLHNAYYLFKDGTLFPITDKTLIGINYKNLSIEKHTAADIKNIEVADLPVKFKDGTLLKTTDSNKVYVIEDGKKRLITDVESFAALGYKRENVISVNPVTIANILTGEPLFINSSLISSQNKYLGDSEVVVNDLFKSSLPAYVIAEYPTGRIISGKNIDKARPIASLVKLLVAYQALNQDFNLIKSTSYSAKKYKASGRNLNISDGASIKNTDLLGAMLVGSTNNTARMIAQNSGGTEKDFITSINSTLKNWGADDTVIVDVTGVDAKNKSTPRNLLKISTKILSNSSIKTALSKNTITVTIGKTKQSVTAPGGNSLLSGKNYTTIASKTGSTDEAGTVTLLLIETREKTPKKYIIIAMGGKDLKNIETNKMAAWISSGTVQITNK